MAGSDVFADLVVLLSDVGGAPVFMGLPHDFEKDHLPVINIVPLGGGTTTLFQGGPVDELHVDVELFFSPDEYVSGRAMVWAARVRRALFMARVGRTIVRGTSRPLPVPDSNNVVRRVVFTAFVVND